MYFPEVIDGGPATSRWQTSLRFLNPNTITTANILINFYSDNGKPLALDFGSGLQTTLSVSVPPNGTATLRSRMASSTILTGWAIAAATIPVQGVLFLKPIQNITPAAELSMPATLPSPRFRSTATKFLGLGVSNVYSDGPISASIAVFDSNGNTMGTRIIIVPALGHSFVTLNQLFPSLSDTFSGSVDISTSGPQLQFAAWGLNSDSATGVSSSLPPGLQSWPIDHWDRIWLVYRKVLWAAQTVLTPNGVNLAPVRLDISYEPIVNAMAKRDGTIQINIALSELISDSPSELAFAVAHELGHIVQYRTGIFAFYPDNPEFDADQWGMLLSLVAGFDPYASAGTLAKLSMATGDASLISQAFDSLSGDLHGSFNTRIDNVYNVMVAICSTPDYASFCSLHKGGVHPHLPPAAPLVSEPKPTPHE